MWKSFLFIWLLEGGGYGRIKKKNRKEYNLRIWLDGSITKDTPNVQGSSWGGIVTINASYIEEAPKAPGVLRVVSSSEKNGMWEYKSSITKIVIQNELKEIEGSIKTTDESSMGDGSVMSYVVPNEDGTTYTAYLQSNKKLYLNPNSSYLFYIFQSNRDRRNGIFRYYKCNKYEWYVFWNEQLNQFRCK